MQTDMTVIYVIFALAVFAFAITGLICALISLKQDQKMEEQEKIIKRLCTELDAEKDRNYKDSFRAMLITLSQDELLRGTRR